MAFLFDTLATTTSTTTKTTPTTSTTSTSTTATTTTSAFLSSSLPQLARRGWKERKSLFPQM